MTDVDLNFLARQLDRVLAEQRSTRDDIRVLSAMVMRLTNTMADLTTEMHAVHQQIAGMNDRIRRAEDAQP